MADDPRREQEKLIETVIDRDLKEIERDTKQIEQDATEVEQLRDTLNELHDHHLVKVAIDGQPYEVRYGSETTVKQLIREALELSGNAGRSAAEWQLKYEGKVLDENEKVESLHLPKGAVLFLSLRAGNLG
jgi:predicted RNase H-like nuclease (RuvC/YqgF family)